ncbi:hypothetical protein [Pelagibacterium limicola]|uniref:hypothetical protein n=1 Tax=Pelagibacterium limicola TaxID=2791022 RepID=UPI0018AFCA99|nr:hypothetical protein [Pelagibacterium limicola]
MALRRIAFVLAAVLLALAMILLIIDGTRTLASNALVVTSLEGTWDDFFPGTLRTAQDYVETAAHPLLWAPVITTLLSWPGWAVLGGLGIAFALLSRTRNRRRLVSIDQL